MLASESSAGESPYKGIIVVGTLLVQRGRHVWRRWSLPQSLTMGVSAQGASTVGVVALCAVATDHRFVDAAMSQE